MPKSLSHIWEMNPDQIIDEVVAAGSADEKEIRLILDAKHAAAIASAGEKQAAATEELSTNILLAADRIAEAGRAQETYAAISRLGNVGSGGGDSCARDRRRASALGELADELTLEPSSLA